MNEDFWMWYPRRARDRQHLFGGHSGRPITHSVDREMTLVLKIVSVRHGLDGQRHSAALSVFMSERGKGRCVVVIRVFAIAKGGGMEAPLTVCAEIVAGTS